MSNLYQLPLLLHYTDGPDAGNLRRLRQQLLAELELAGGQTLPVGTRQYTKDDILKACDAGTNDAETALALEIVRRPWLLRFLSEAELPEAFPVEVDDAVLQHQEIRQYIFPYLAEAYWQSWLDCFETLDEAGARRWMQFQPLEYFGQARKEALASVRIYLERDLELTNRHYQSSSPGQSGLHNSRILDCLPRLVAQIKVLPEDFQDLKTGYAKAWNRLFLHLAKHKNAQAVRTELECLHDLLPEKSPVHARLWEEFEEAFNPQTKATTFAQASGRSPETEPPSQFVEQDSAPEIQWVGWVLAILAFILFKAYC